MSGVGRFFRRNPDLFVPNKAKNIKGIRIQTITNYVKLIVNLINNYYTILRTQKEKSREANSLDKELLLS